MPALLLVLLALLQDRAEQFHSRVTFDRPEPQSAEERRVLELLTKKEPWLEAFRSVEERAGRFPDGLSVKVGFDWPGDDYAHGGSGAAGGWVRFNLKKLAEYQKKVDELEERRLAEEKKGRRLVFRVPPARFDRMIWHELTHVLQRGIDSPDWFKEGMAVWVSDDPNCLLSFANGGKKAETIETALGDRNDTYARGHLFWKWLESKGLAKKVIDASVTARKPWKAALEESCGMGWEALATAELEWSRKELEKLRPKPK